MFFISPRAEQGEVMMKSSLSSVGTGSNLLGRVHFKRLGAHQHTDMQFNLLTFSCYRDQYQATSSFDTCHVRSSPFKLNYIMSSFILPPNFSVKHFQAIKVRHASLMVPAHNTHTAQPLPFCYKCHLINDDVISFPPTGWTLLPAPCQEIYY